MGDMADHELLQYAMKGNLKGVVNALERGAMVEARRPLAMRPREELDTPLDALDNGMEGMTALMFASQGGSTAIVQRLLEAKAHINAVEEEEWSALHFAAQEGRLEVCQ